VLGHARANALAAKLKVAMGSDAKVTRPVKFGEIRISGIDPSVSPEELVGKLAKLRE